MAPERWKDIAELIGIAAIVASLVFVGLQMQQTEDVARYELFSTAVTPVDVATLVSQNRAIWLKGCAGVELDEEEWLTFIQVADIVTILRNSAWARGRLIESSLGPEREVYRMALDLHSNSGLRKAWEARRSHAHQRNEFVGHSDSSFSFVVEEMLEELEKRPPKILTDGPLCGSR